MILSHEFFFLFNGSTRLVVVVAGFGRRSEGPVLEFDGCEGLGLRLWEEGDCGVEGWG